MTESENPVTVRRGPGRPKLDNKMEPMSIRLPPQFKKALQEEAQRFKVKPATLVEIILKRARPDIPWE